jgi:hypothetical protein
MLIQKLPIFLTLILLVHCEKEEFFQIITKDTSPIQARSQVVVKGQEPTFQVGVNRKALHSHLFETETFSDIQIELQKEGDTKGYLVKGISADHIFRKLLKLEAGDVFLSLGGYSLEDKSGLILGFRSVFSNSESILVEILRKGGNKELVLISFLSTKKKSPVSISSNRVKVILTPKELSGFRAELSGYEFTETNEKKGYLVPELKEPDIAYFIGLNKGDLIYNLNGHEMTEPHSLYDYYKAEPSEKIQFYVLREKGTHFFEVISFVQSPIKDQTTGEEPEYNFVMPEGMVIPINPETNKPFSKVEMWQFITLKKLFPKNSLIPEFVTPQEQEILLEKAKLQRSRNIDFEKGVLEPKAAPEFFEVKEKELKDRIEIFQFFAEKDSDSKDSPDFKSLHKKAVKSLEEFLEKKEVYQKKQKEQEK